MRVQTTGKRNAASQDPGPGGCPGRGSEFRPHRRRPQGRTPSLPPEGNRSRTRPQVGTALGRYRGGHIGPVGPPPIAGCERGCDPLSTRHAKAEKGVPQIGLSTHSGSGVIWDSGCGPGPSRPVELTVSNTRTLLSRSARVWHESLTCPRRFRL
jgi:hypothetical protein